MSNDWPYMTLQLKKAGFFDKFSSQKNEENALIEINNILADRKNIQSLSTSDIATILNKYKLKYTRSLQENMTCLYRGYLIHCLKDKKLSDEEIRDLQYLKTLFGFDDRTVDDIHNEQYDIIYRKSYQDIIKDGLISEEEKVFLNSLHNNLRLPEWIVEKITVEEATKYVQGKVDQAIEDQRLSPEEEAEIQKITSNLGVNVQLSEASKSVLDKYRLLWLIENGEIPVLSVPINLQRGERCYFQTNAELHEYRKVTTRIRYSGPTARIKIIKGFYWRAGDLKLNPVSKDVFTKLDNGYLYLTNKKILFMGSLKNVSIPLNKIICFNPYTDGVEIQKSTGRNPFFLFKHNNDVFFALLNRTLRDMS